MLFQAGQEFREEFFPTARFLLAFCYLNAPFALLATKSLAGGGKMCFNTAVPLVPSEISPSLLPVKLPWGAEADVAQYAYKCMSALGLDAWRFGWEKTVRRMGCCKNAPRMVLLSVYFVRKFLPQDQELIRHTILHELAHALAWEYNRTARHDGTWHAFCQALGIGDARACTRCDDFAPPEHPSRRCRYALYNLETGEVYQKFSRFPARTFKYIGQVYIKGRKRETLGKLGIRPLSDAGEY